MTTNQAAKEVGVSRVTIYNWIHQGLLKPPPRPMRRRYPKEKARRRMPQWTAEYIEAARRVKKSIRRGSPFLVLDVSRIRELRVQGLSWDAIAKQVGCSAPTAASRAN
jgi:excisionase family DNA binding protein